MREAEEGVIKFSFEHTAAEFIPDSWRDLVYRLVAWRNLLFETGLIGQDPGRYDGAGYGNLSGRLQPFPGERGERRFVISGTQTGGQDCTGVQDYSVIRAYDIRRNHVISEGPALPSSESMTHGAVYDLSPDVRFVFHGHSPVIWNNSRALNIPLTDRTVPYGTPAMAWEVARLYRESNLAEARILSMGGHRDGVIAFGRSAEEAGQVLLANLARAYEIVARAENRLCSYPGT